MTYHAPDFPEMGEIPNEDVFDCDECEGSGEIWRTLGGDGYGNRCCGTMDYPTECEDCKGSGQVCGYRGNGDHYEAIAVVQPQTVGA